MKIVKSILWGIPLGFINGFFGSGGGVIGVIILRKIFNTEVKKAHATTIAIILPVTCASLFVYLKPEGINLQQVVLCSIGGVLGGLTGAKLLDKIPQKYLRIIFGIVMIISGGRMIL